jgi:hypothetical protein
MNYNFSIILGSIDNEEHFANLIYNGCDDSLLSFSNGIYELEFDRDASSLEEAIISAIQDFEGAETGIDIIGIVF